MAARQRDIAVSEFFAKNRHLLGFDNPTKALLTTVREAVDNALDACEEAQILPEILVSIEEVGALKSGPKSVSAPSKYAITIEDNGPGIVKAQLGKIFGRLLYGSKFHRLKQSRGQQGIGISAAVMYGQMTTGEPALIVSKTGKGRPANRVRLLIETRSNKPKLSDEEVLTGDEHWDNKVSGTAVTVTLEGHYKGGKHSVAAYLRQTALANPHARIVYRSPKGKTFEYPRVTSTLPVEPKEIKPHPHGIELGTMQQMMTDAKGQTVSGFLTGSFSRVSSAVAQQVCNSAGVSTRAQVNKLKRDNAELVYRHLQEMKLMAPPTNCLSPIGEESIVKGLYWLFVQAQEEAAAEKAAAQAEAQLALATEEGAPTDEAKEGPAETAEEGVPDTIEQIRLDDDGAIADDEAGYFVTACTRPPTVYRGNPFQVEVGLFYGKGLPADELARCYRFANRVPLQYQSSGCGMTKAVISAPWRNYEMSQSRGALPAGPLVLMVHIASGWVPYTSESKEAIAHYPEILKEMRLAVMECGRRLQRFMRRRKREAMEAKKRSYITKYLDPIGEALQEILGLGDQERDATVDDLKVILEKTRSGPDNRIVGRKKKKAEKKPDEAPEKPSGKAGQLELIASSTTKAPAKKSAKKAPAKKSAKKAPAKKSAKKAPAKKKKKTTKKAPAKKKKTAKKAGKKKAPKKTAKRSTTKTVKKRATKKAKR